MAWLAMFADQRQPGRSFAGLLLRVLVEIGQPGPIEALGQGANARADRHLVVVENDQQLSAQMPGVVERLEDDAAGQGAVADHGHAVAIALAEQVVADFQPQRGGDARSRHARS